MSRLALFLLGPPRIEIDGITLDIGRRKAEALLIYLAVTEQRHSRDTLAALFWPDFGQAEARGALRRTLAVLKAALKDRWLEIEREALALDCGGVWTDAAYFRGALAECRSHSHGAEETCPACLGPLTAAVEVYRDSFLAGFTLRDSPGFDEWQMYQVEHLRGESVEALAKLAGYYASSGELEMATAYARRWLALDPLNETAHRRLMQIHALKGHRSAALRQYDECVRVLDEEMGLAPQTETTRLYEVIKTDDEGVISQPQPIKLRLHPSTIPMPPTPFIGRAQELAAIRQHLEDSDCRLLTITGLGGIGKTRLAVQAVSGYEPLHGVYYVSLIAVSSAELLPLAIAEALHLPVGGCQHPAEQVLAYLREKTLWLLLDNFEHLLDGAAFVTDILEQAPGVKILVTSRERLNLRGEWLIELVGLSYPLAAEPTHIEEYSAVQLFLTSVRRLQSGFSLAATDYPAVIRLCQLVEGMPLGIELAAAWIRLMSCEEIALEIEGNLDFLEAALRDLPERHRSLRRVFEHSWRLLSDDEQILLRRLSVFWGGFSRDAAEKIAGASLPLLSGLMDKSLLRRAGAGRFELHELLRQYAADKLGGDLDEQKATQDDHAGYYATFLDRRQERLKGSDQPKAIEEIEADLANIRLAWQRAVDINSESLIEQAVDSLHRFYIARGFVKEGADAFSRAAHMLRVNDCSAQTLGKVLTRWGTFFNFFGQYERAQTLAQEGLSIAEKTGNGYEKAFAFSILGAVAFNQGSYALARELYENSLALMKSVGDEAGIAAQHYELAWTVWRLGLQTEALQYFQESLTLAEQIGDQKRMAQIFQGLGVLARESGNYQAAEAYLRKSLVIARMLNSQVRVAFALNSIGVLAMQQGKHEVARQQFTESLEIFREIGDREGLSNAQGNLGIVATLLKDDLGAQHHFEEALAVMKVIGNRVGIAEVLSHLGHLALRQTQYSQALACFEQSLETSREIGAQREIAIALNNLGTLSTRLGDYEKAMQYFQGALRITVEIQVLPVTLESMLGVATLWDRLSRKSQALDLLRIISNHPATGNDLKSRAQPFAERLMAEVVAENHSPMLDLEGAIRLIMTEAKSSTR